MPTFSVPPFTRHTLRATVTAMLVVVVLTGEMPPATATTVTATRSTWTWPTDGTHPIIRPFIAPATPYSAGHRGIDIAAPAGAIVRSPDGGIIHFSGFVVNRSLVSISHGGGLISSFEPVLSELAEGTVVHRGEPIGTLQSGHCRVPCLHLGARLNSQYISPLNFLGGIPWSVLLPTRAIP